MIDESHLLSEFPSGFSIEETSEIDETFFACERGTGLWDAYRLTHPEAPERPPVAQELWPDLEADAYFEHSSTCLKCLED